MHVVCHHCNRFADCSALGVCRRRLLAAAKDGKSDEAETVLRDMSAAGHQPGGRAYHGLICAYCKAGDSQGALTAVRRAVQEGVHEQNIFQLPNYFLVMLLSTVHNRICLCCRHSTHSRDLSGADACNDAERGQQGSLQGVSEHALGGH